MPKIDPFVGLFIAIAALHAGMFMWLRADIAEVREDVVGVSERLTRIEAGLAELRGELAATNERMARIEGTVAGALGRPFPERMARVRPRRRPGGLNGARSRCSGEASLPVRRSHRPSGWIRRAPAVVIEATGSVPGAHRSP